MVSTASDPTQRQLRFPPGVGVPTSLSAAGWKIGSGAVSLGLGDLVLRPSVEGSLIVNGEPYRGTLRLVSVGGGKFDVINELDVDGYLKGVLPKELYANWHPQTYRAQAIVARTYALYEARTEGSNRYWDLYPDQRSQMYGGLRAETTASRSAVDETSGIVLVYSPDPNVTGRIFKAYFSSCCGGVTQSAADAFPGDPLIPPLIAQSVGPLCNAAPKFNWGPVAIRKDELTRRFHAWAERKARLDGRVRPEATIGTIERIEVANSNIFSRPTRFLVTDARGVQYSMSSEELHSAADADAPTAGPQIYSTFMKVDNEPGSDSIRFVDGHGNGHGVGMCQWCAQTRALAGLSHEEILAAAFHQSRRARAY